MTEEEIALAITLFRSIKFPKGSKPCLERQFLRHIYARAMEDEPEPLSPQERQQLLGTAQKFGIQSSSPKRRPC